MKPTLNILLDAQQNFAGFTLSLGGEVKVALSRNEDGQTFSLNKTMEGFPEKLTLRDALSTLAMGLRQAQSYCINGKPSSERDIVVTLVNQELKHGLSSPYLEGMRKEGVSTAAIDRIIASKTFTRANEAELWGMLQKLHYAESEVAIATSGGIPLIVAYNDGVSHYAVTREPDGQYVRDDGQDAQKYSLDQLLQHTKAFSATVKGHRIDGQDMSEASFSKALHGYQFSLKEDLLEENVDRLMHDQGLNDSKSRAGRQHLHTLLATNQVNLHSAMEGKDIAKEDIGDLASQSHLPQALLKEAFKRIPRN